MDYLVRFAQVHESFHKPEIEAIATLYHINLQWVFYSNEVRICHIALLHLLSFCLLNKDAIFAICRFLCSDTAQNNFF